ncbi:alpha-humulene 10-hydroxylase-like [Zingiber officinale]|nr:alpha-humulene 10-hydroxylase-like [Zingiber officinale]
MEFQLPSLPISLSIFFVLLIIVRRLFTSKPNHVGPEFPTPSRLPFIGNFHHLVGKQPHHALRDLARKHGNVMKLQLGQVDQIIISSREGAQQVLKEQDANFAFRPEITAAKIIAYGQSDIAFSNGKYWRQLRKICVMELLGSKRVKSFASLRKEKVDRLMSDVSYAAAIGKPVNLGERLNELTNSIVVQASFGRSCPQQKKFMQILKEVVIMSSGFSVGDLFPSLKVVDVLTGFSAQLIKYHKKLDVVLDEIIKEHQMNRDRGEQEDLIDVLLRLKDEGNLEVPISFGNIKAVAIDMFAGGTDSTASLIEWAMSELMLRPSTLERAQKEVREAMKDKGYIEETDVPQFNYIHQVVKETLRLHPPFPILFPRVAQETTEVLGYTLPAGTRVLINVWALGRDPRYWKDAESFRPERFEEGVDKEFKGNDFEFLPFGAGRRMCAGMTFGLTTLELTLSKFLFHFDWAFPKGVKAEDIDMSETFGASVSKKVNLLLVPSLRYPFPTFE